LNYKAEQVDFDSAIPRFESWRPSQQVVCFSKAYGCCEIAREDVAFVARSPVSRIANTRTKTGISASVSKGQFWALVFISAVTRASGAIRPQSPIIICEAALLPRNSMSKSECDALLSPAKGDSGPEFTQLPPVIICAYA